MDSLSPAMQEYLAEAYRLAYNQSDTAFVSTSDLAEVMHVSAPAVTRMVQRLKAAGYLDHEPYRGIALTPAGEREALTSIRKHRLVERFLVDVMHFAWHEVHDAADDFGAVVSDRLVARMADMAGHPRRCPHGEPIPTADGHMPRVVDQRLNDGVEVGAERIVSRVASHDAERLRYLGELGLTPGTHFTLLEKAPFHGPLQLLVKGERVVIGHELAGALRVCTAEEYELV